MFEIDLKGGGRVDLTEHYHNITIVDYYIFKLILVQENKKSLQCSDDGGDTL